VCVCVCVSRRDTGIFLHSVLDVVVFATYRDLISRDGRIRSFRAFPMNSLAYERNTIARWDSACTTRIRFPFHPAAEGIYDRSRSLKASYRDRFESTECAVKLHARTQHAPNNLPRLFYGDPIVPRDTRPFPATRVPAARACVRTRRTARDRPGPITCWRQVRAALTNGTVGTRALPADYRKTRLPANEERASLWEDR